MTVEEIQQVATKSANSFYKWLDDNRKGRVEIAVRRVYESRNTNEFRLLLAKPLFDAQSVFLHIISLDEDLDQDSVEILAYDEKKLTLTVQVPRNRSAWFRTAPDGDLMVISDLKFLVRRVQTYFEENGPYIRMPQRASSLSPVDYGFFPELEPNAMQKDALKMIFRRPFSYVWGAPGTGKTQFVLAYAVLQYVRAGKKVAVLAPTNNAIEQVLRGLIFMTDLEGLDRSKIIRLGRPTDAFRTEFGEVCEDQRARRQLRQVKRQVEALEETERRVNLMEALEEARKCLDAFALLENEVTKWESGETKRDVIDQRLASIKSGLTGWPKAAQLSKDLKVDNRREVQQQLENWWKEEAGALGVGQEPNPGNDLLGKDWKTQLESLRERVRLLEEKQTNNRIANASIVACTLDGFIGRFTDTRLKADHFFLDEAGYAPLIKAMTLLRSRGPVTFLGDHFQLPPVCEMQDREILAKEEHQDIFLWAQAAINIEDVYTGELAEARERYFKRALPRFEHLKEKRLLLTHRFGAGLARVLDEYVYGNIGFGSAVDEGETGIYLMDIRELEEPRRNRLNEAEALAIQQWVMSQAGHGDAVILSPYLDQIRRIGKLLPQWRRQGRILSVHGSQGREWDTVILSVSDGRQRRPWFTDSQNMQSHGRYLINTAVSRARKRLILVCDAAYWLAQPRQLIGGLARVAHPIEEMDTRMDELWEST